MSLQGLRKVHGQIRACRKCPQVCGTPVHGPALETSVMLIGQAPGVHESLRGKPFAHTAGRTLFQWLNQATGFSEDEIRESIYIAAVARCFPGKSRSGSGDREPSPEEISNCRPYLESEILALRPKVLLAVGKVAISEVLGPALFPKNSPLTDVVGRKIRCDFRGLPVDVIPLPHPSGISRWPKVEPGKSCLRKALRLIGETLPPYFEAHSGL